jgi:hypothetical protein
MKGMKRIMRETAMKDNQTTTSKRQSLRSWRTCRRKVAQALPSLLLVLAVGMLQGCGDGGGSIDSVGTPVTPSGNSVTLLWDPPINSDGTAVSNLVGYNAYYATTSPITVDNSQILAVGGDTTTVALTDLPVGTYYVAVTAVYVGGVESDLTSEVTAVIQ